MTVSTEVTSAINDIVKQLERKDVSQQASEESASTDAVSTLPQVSAAEVDDETAGATLDATAEHAAQGERESTPTTLENLDIDDTDDKAAVMSGQDGDAQANPEQAAGETERSDDLPEVHESAQAINEVTAAAASSSDKSGANAVNGQQRRKRASGPAPTSISGGQKASAFKPVEYDEQELAALHACNFWESTAAGAIEDAINEQERQAAAIAMQRAFRAKTVDNLLRTFAEQATTAEPEPQLKLSTASKTPPLTKLAFGAIQKTDDDLQKTAAQSCALALQHVSPGHSARLSPTMPFRLVGADEPISSSVWTLETPSAFAKSMGLKPMTAQNGSFLHRTVGDSIVDFPTDSRLIMSPLGKRAFNNGYSVEPMSGANVFGVEQFMVGTAYFLQDFMKSNEVTELTDIFTDMFGLKAADGRALVRAIGDGVGGFAHEYRCHLQQRKMLTAAPASRLNSLKRLRSTVSGNPESGSVEEIGEEPTLSAHGSVLAPAELPLERPVIPEATNRTKFCDEQQTKVKVQGEERHIQLDLEAQQQHQEYLERGHLHNVTEETREHISQIDHIAVDAEKKSGWGASLAGWLFGSNDPEMEEHSPEDRFDLESGSDSESESRLAHFATAATEVGRGLEGMYGYAGDDSYVDPTGMFNV